MVGLLVRDRPFYLQVDVVICDIPFGRQYGTIEGCRDTLYKAVVKKIESTCYRCQVGATDVFAMTCLHSACWGRRDRSDHSFRISINRFLYCTVLGSHSPIHSNVCLLHSCQQQQAILAEFDRATLPVVGGCSMFFTISSC